MGKRSRELRSNMYEGDIDILEDVIKVKNIEKRNEKPIKIKQSLVQKDTHHVASLDTPISDRIVSCGCNKCGNSVNGILTSYIYSVSGDSIGMCTPFVIYECSKCGHSGRRSVLAKAMIPKDFEKYYFS